MALSFNSYLPRPYDTTLQLVTGDCSETVSLTINEEVFDSHGRLRGQSRLSVDRVCRLFTLSWPTLAAKCMLVESHWRLVVTKATDNRIARFYRDTAENLGSNNWEVVKKAVSDCRSKFHARLQSMSNQEIVFCHQDQQAAERMKESNEMMDIMNTLLTDVDCAFNDILVDWEVTVVPVKSALYQPTGSDTELHSLLQTDSDSPPVSNSKLPKATKEDQQPVIQKLLDAIWAESHKTQAALNKIQKDICHQEKINTDRHHILCQKIEELKAGLHPGSSSGGGGVGGGGDGTANNSGIVASQGEQSVTENEEENEDSIPATALFGDQSDRGGAPYGQWGDRQTRGNSSHGSDPMGNYSHSQDQRKNSSHSPDQSRNSSSSLDQRGNSSHSADQRGNSNLGVDQKGNSSRSLDQRVNSSHGADQRGNSQPDSSTPGQADPASLSQQLALSQTMESTTHVLRRESTAKPSETHKDLTGTDLENRNLDEAVERAYRHDDDPAPKAKSFYTILCLDVSESMKKHGAFEEMKKIVTQFIDGVEDIVTNMGVEENIGLVTFGGTSEVVQNVTNDFSRIRDAIDNLTLGGRSPFVQALMVSMAAFVEKAGIISVSRVYDVKPRIIFISDGYPTENYDDNGADYAYNKMHVRSGVTRLMMNFANKDKYSKVHPVVYIPVGKNPDKELMQSMATLSQGEYLEPRRMGELCSYFMLQDTIGKTLACVVDNQDCSETQIEALATGLMPGLTPEQKAHLMKVVLEERANPQQQPHKKRRSNFEDTFENTQKVNAGDMLPLGTRVTRGVDWTYNDQDGNGPGTVFSHSDKNGWTWVNWDYAGHNRYPYGPDQGFYIWRTEEFPRLMGDDGELEIGMLVDRGPDWNPTEERLLKVRTGVVIRKSKSEKKLMVRWDNAELQVVRYGADDKYDVSYCDPMTVQRDLCPTYYSASQAPGAPVGSQEVSAAQRSPHNIKGRAPAGTAVGFEHGLWQHQEEDGRWEDYSPADNDNIEKNYKRRPDTGTCIVSRHGNSRRVMFRRMMEKVVDSGVECCVRRIPHPHHADQ